ncbi:MAG TPA: P-loop NTPase fold protein [Actinocrinis sp.]|nr:P-loop NTPase fold protein [Actinocrinis sp.]
MAEPVVLPGAFGGHPGPVFALAYGPSGLLASGGWDGTVRLWQLSQGTATDVLRGHVGSVRALAFLADGAMLVSVGRDRTVRVWDTAGQREPVVLWNRDPAALSVSADPRDGRVATVHRDGTVRIWPRDAWNEPMTLAEPGSAVTFSPDGRLLAAGDDRGTIRIWDVSPTGANLLGAHDSGVGAVRKIVYAPDGRLFAYIGDDGTAFVRSHDSLAAANQVTDDTVTALSLAFPPDSRRLAVGTTEGAVQVYDLTAPLPRLITTYSGHSGPAYGVAYSPDGSNLTTAGDDGAIRLWTAEQDAEPVELVGHYSEILSVACSPDGRRIATGDVDGVVRVWDTRVGRLCATRASGVRDWVRALTFSENGAYLAAAVGHNLCAWDAKDDEYSMLHSQGVDDEAVSTAFCRNEAGVTRIMCLDRAGSVRIVAARDGAIVAAYPPPADHVQAASLVALPHAALTAFAIAFRDGVVIRNPAGAESAAATPGVISHLAVTGDGSALIAGGDDGTVRLWNWAAGPDPLQPPLELRGHTGGVNAVAASPNGALVASGGDDTTVRLWDRRSGLALRVLNGHGGAVRGVAFTPDGVTLVSVGDDGRIAQWNVRSGKLVRISGQTVRPMPRIPGLNSDEPSPVDQLGMADDVRTLAALVAAAGTRPPLAIALLGEWGAGKSSIMLQMRHTIDRLATLSRANPGQSLFVGNVRQVCFNAWHYNDASVWTGLIEQLFSVLAAEQDPEAGPMDLAAAEHTRDRLRRELDAERAYRARLDRLRPATVLRARWRDLRAWSLGALFAATVYCAGWAWRRVGAVSGAPTSLLQRAWVWGRTLGQPSGALDTAREDAVRRIEVLEDRLARLDTAARLAVLLRESTRDTYTNQRGLIGQVHRDLETLDTVLADLRRRHSAAPESNTEIPQVPLERIVLYIDDLDRCAPARIAEVLAAIHLMLALPLFIVVVAVDPRWLCSALSEHHRGLLAVDSDAVRAATALDYLGKIFQIPFAVHQPADAALGRYLTFLLSDNQEDHGPRAGVAPLAESAFPPDERSHARGDRSTNGASADSRTALPTDAPEDRPRPIAAAADTVPDLRPGGLILRSAEVAFMQRLGSLLTTPRAAKRLVNVYRLVRVAIPDDDLQGFVDTGTYQTVQILLAVLVGEPTVASAVFTAIRDAAPDTDIVDVVEAAGPRCATLARVLRETKSTAALPGDALDISAFKTWCPRLTRYSFHLVDFGS